MAGTATEIVVLVTPDRVAHVRRDCERVGAGQVRNIVLYPNLAEAQKVVGPELQICECLKGVADPAAVSLLTRHLSNPDADGAEAGFGFTYCPKCGRVLPLIGRRCPHCGHSDTPE